MQYSIEVLVGQLLRDKGLKLATAESCTGGLVADRITNVTGSSEYFRGGIVAYAYEAKVALLNVSWDTLRMYGAVSKETVIEMARGARVALGTDIAISVSGIAGPGGGFPDNGCTDSEPHGAPSQRGRPAADWSSDSLRRRASTGCRG